MSEQKINRKVKDTVFSSLFYECEYAVENAKELYKAVRGRTVNEIEKCRLEDVLFRERKNDIAYVMDKRLVSFMEHQSTENPNMPLRYLLYAARTYERENLTGAKVLYSGRLVRIPKPEFYVLYNGSSELKSTELRLSDAFMEEADEDDNSLEIRVRVIDINFDKLIQNEALRNCKPLYGYSYLIDKTRSYKGDTEKAVWDCMDHDILKEYLEFYGSEVINMLNIEYNEEDARKYLVRESREDGFVDGWKQGQSEGEAKMLKKLQKLGNSIKQLSVMFEMPESEIEKLLAMDI
ncbi:MAG: hypothetical protein IJ192_00460 [Clostridia bacterium]|nr:hypothetical protein [Clostridia bacterium]